MNTENPISSVDVTPAVSPYQVSRVGILAFYLGCFGVHRFYTGRPILGVLQLLTFGGLGVWALIDLILVLCGVTKDGNGLPIKKWDFEDSPSDKRLLPAFLLAFFFGVFGVHRFYVGKIGTGILQLVTFGGVGIWALIDIVVLAWGRFTDKSGHYVSRWT